MKWVGAAILTALAIAFFWISARGRSAGKAKSNIRRHLDATGDVGAGSPVPGLFGRLCARFESTRRAVELRARLEASGLEIRWVVLRRFWAASILLVPPAAALSTGSLLSMPPALAAVIFLPGLALGALARRRERAGAAECDRLAADLALFLRSGIPIDDALSLCAEDAGPLIAGAVSRYEAEVSLGACADEALEDLVGALDNPNVRLIAQAVITSHETGSDVGNIMEAIGEAVRERAAIKRELASLTVQGRLSGRIVAALPLVFLGISALASHSTVSILIGTFPGLLMLGAAAVMNTVGFIWIRKIMDVR